MIGVYAGSFDPFTNGHLEIVRQASKVFSKVIVLVASNSEKKHWLSHEERKDIIIEAIGTTAEVDVLHAPATSSEYAFKRQAHLIRGIGEFTDYPAEKSLLNINCRLRPEVETVFLMSRGINNQMRSSAVREAIKFQFGWRSIRDDVPRATANAVFMKLLKAKFPQLEPLIESKDLLHYRKRAYHNFEHICYMLDMAEILDADHSKADSLDLAAAVLYHDIFVDSDTGVSASEDVEKSMQYFAAAQYSHCKQSRVLELIKATDHRNFLLRPNVDMSTGQELIAKLDMYILGETAYEYARYAQSIREEYLPKYGYEKFVRGRISFLHSILGRLEVAPLLDEQRDRQVKQNAMWELCELEKSPQAGF